MSCGGHFVCVYIYIHISRRREWDWSQKKTRKETMSQNFPNLMKNTDLQIQEAQWTTSRIKRTTIGIKDELLKIKRKSWKKPKEKIKYYMWEQRIVIADLSSETMEAKRLWNHIFKVLKEKQEQNGHFLLKLSWENLSPGNLYYKKC